MEARPDIDMCAHTAEVINSTTGKKNNVVMPSKEDCVFKLDDVIWGGGGFVATNSLFFKRDLFDNIPESRRFLMLDYTLQIQGSIKGGMLYLKDSMSVYRSGVPNSWTDRIRKDISSFKNHVYKVEEMLNILDRELDYKYTDIIQKKISYNKFNLLYNFSDIDAILKEPYKAFYNKLSLKQKIKLHILGTLKKILGNR